MAKGKVTWVNPPDNKGKITRTDDGSNSVYEYNVSAGDTVNGYVPKEEDLVEFIPASAGHATNVSQIQADQITSFTYCLGTDTDPTKKQTWDYIGNPYRGRIDNANGTYEMDKDQLAIKSRDMERGESEPFTMYIYDENGNELDSKPGIEKC